MSKPTYRSLALDPAAPTIRPARRRFLQATLLAGLGIALITLTLSSVDHRTKLKSLFDLALPSSTAETCSLLPTFTLTAGRKSVRSESSSNRTFWMKDDKGHSSSFFPVEANISTNISARLEYTSSSTTRVGVDGQDCAPILAFNAPSSAPYSIPSTWRDNSIMLGMSSLVSVYLAR